MPSATAPFASAAPPASPATAPTPRARWSTRSSPPAGRRPSSSRPSPSARSRSRSSRAASIPTRGYEPLLDELLRPILRAASRTASASSATSARRIRAARRDASPRSPPSSACAAPKIAVVDGDDLSAPRAAAAAARRARRERRLDGVRHRGQRQRLPRRRCRSPRRCRAARTSSSPAASPIRRSPSAPRSRTSAGARDDWDRLGARDDGRPSARMRRAGHRRLLRRSRLQGRARPRPRRLPIAEIDADGTARSPRPRTGGRVDAHTVKEQLLYEVHDPAAYLTPDVVADISEARGRELGPDRVRARRRARPSAPRDA